ncbi:MAG: helix-turn-helix domain-containing protein [Ruminococcaceae bacterium]|nr:helix-turn-helix domain-containing protein [Oscillospiraceae bacterium]
MIQEYILEGKVKGEKGIPFAYHEQDTEKRRLCARNHLHEYLELIYCHKGRHTLELNGIASDFLTGELVVIPPNTIHRITSLCDPGSFYSVVTVDINVMYSVVGAVSEFSYLLPFHTGGTSYRTRFFPRELEEGQIPGIIEEIRREFEQKKYGYEIALKIQAERLILWILRQWEAEHRLPVGKQAKKLNHILDYLWKNYDRKLQGVEVAKEFFISYSHFSALIRSATGCNFVKYLNYIRITQAKKILISTDKSITEIALDTGFSSTSYFIEQFREFEGISPGKFKKQLEQ